MDNIPDKSYGIIPVFKGKTSFLFLLVHHKGNHWAFPKGHKKEGESDLETVKRELFEETGIKDCKILDIPIIQEHYSFELKGKKYDKTNNFYIGLVKNKDHSTPSDFLNEIEEIRWATYSEAIKLATYDTAKNLLKQVSQALDDYNHEK